MANPSRRSREALVDVDIDTSSTPYKGFERMPIAGKWRSDTDASEGTADRPTPPAEGIFYCGGQNPPDFLR